MSLSYSYPIISNSNYRNGKMYLRKALSSSAEARALDGSVYVLKDKFKVLHFINLVGGIAHGYTNFRTEAFNPVLFEVQLYLVPLMMFRYTRDLTMGK
jgi:hypothetical protein